MSDPRCNTCGAPLLWAKTSNGGSIPLDARPDPMGNLVLDERGRIGPAIGDPGHPDYTARYTRHSCKDRDP